jgi:riboflavin kinase/FMN adenylyltransferase
VTIGVLDGVHIGHRALIRGLEADGLATVLTFEPHPIEVLRPGTMPRLITTIEERIALFDGAGVELLGVLDLAEIRDLRPEEFVEGILVEKLHARSLTVGSDFRFGKDRVGDVDLLEALGVEHGYRVNSIDLVGDRGEPVSSSRIRALIESGQVEEAARLLGSRFQITNAVVDGDKRGKDIGFPTANLRPPERKVIPATGIYAALARVGPTEYIAAVNVGVRPTFGGGELLIEAYLLDFDGDLYGETLTVEFVRWIRPELEFDNVDELIERMRSDVETTREILESLDLVVG